MSLNNIIVLIYPYFKTEDNINQKLFNPLGLAFLSAQLKQNGIKVVKIDCTFKSPEKVIEEISSYKPKIIGFYTMITFTKSIHYLIENLRLKLPSSLYICGGPLATVFPEIYKDDFDVIFRGEMDQSFPNFVKEFFHYNTDKGNFIRYSDLTRYSGIYINKPEFYFEKENIHLTKEEFKALPLPDRKGFDHYNYQKFWQEKEGIKATNIITTVGCPFICDFCSKPIFGEYFRERKIDHIIREIRQIKLLGYNYLWISDDCFSLNDKFLDNFCNNLIARKLDINWCCLSRIDTLNINVLQKMKISGCDKVYLGLESGNNDVLKLMNKNLTIEQGEIAVKQLKNVGIKTAGFFIVGYPGETLDTIDQTFTYALSLNLDEVSFNVPYPLPGSELFRRISKINITRDWTVENETKFVYESDFDEKLLKKKIEEFYKKFNASKVQFPFNL